MEFHIGNQRVLTKERKSIVRKALGNGETAVKWPLPRMRFNQRVFKADIKGVSHFWRNEMIANYYGLDAVFGIEPGFEYYDETEPWLTANSDFGDLQLIDVSKYSDKKLCFLYFRLSANRNVDVNWDKLLFHFAYTYDGSLHKEIIGLLPDKLFWNLGTRGQIETRPYQIGEDYVSYSQFPRCTLISTELNSE